MMNAKKFFLIFLCVFVPCSIEFVLKQVSGLYIGFLGAVILYLPALYLIKKIYHSDIGVKKYDSPNIVSVKARASDENNKKIRFNSSIVFPIIVLCFSIFLFSVQQRSISKLRSQIEVLSNENISLKDQLKEAQKDISAHDRLLDFYDWRIGNVYEVRGNEIYDLRNRISELEYYLGL